MSPDGYWDMYGPNSHWNEMDSLLTEDQVREFVLSKKFKESKQKEKELKDLEKKLTVEYETWQKTF